MEYNTNYSLYCHPFLFFFGDWILTAVTVSNSLRLPVHIMFIQRCLGSSPVWPNMTFSNNICLKLFCCIFFFLPPKSATTSSSRSLISPTFALKLNRVWSRLPRASCTPGRWITRFSQTRSSSAANVEPPASSPAWPVPAALARWFVSTTPRTSAPVLGAASHSSESSVNWTQQCGALPLSVN